jgi:hypothetical protein
MPPKRRGTATTTVPAPKRVTLRLKLPESSPETSASPSVRTHRARRAPNLTTWFRGIPLDQQRTVIANAVRRDMRVRKVASRDPTGRFLHSSGLMHDIAEMVEATAVSTRAMVQYFQDDSDIGKAVAIERLRYEKGEYSEAEEPTSVSESLRSSDSLHSMLASPGSSGAEYMGGDDEWLPPHVHGDASPHERTPPEWQTDGSLEEVEETESEASGPRPTPPPPRRRVAVAAPHLQGRGAFTPLQFSDILVDGKYDESVVKRFLTKPIVKEAAQRRGLTLNNSKKSTIIQFISQRPYSEYEEYRSQLGHNVKRRPTGEHLPLPTGGAGAVRKMTQKQLKDVLKQHGARLGVPTGSASKKDMMKMLYGVE